MDLSFLPALNACLNATAAILLLAGRRLIRRGRLVAHRRTMLCATAVSAVFLISYVIHKASRDFHSTTLHVGGPAKVAYLALLFSHLSLALTLPVLAPTLVILGWRDARAPHRRLARIVWPLWLYVSLTGIAIYVLLYHLNPAPQA